MKNRQSTGQPHKHMQRMQLLEDKQVKVKVRLQDQGLPPESQGDGVSWTLSQCLSGEG